MSEISRPPSSGDPEPKVSIDRDQNNSEGPSDARKGAAEIRTKALSGVAMVAGRDVLVKVTALLGNVAFARLLSPSNFGTVAFGLVMLQFVQLLSDGGLGVGLIRRPEAPDAEDLRVLLGYQLILTITLAGAIAAIGAIGPFGRAGLVTAVMMCSLPLFAFRVPSSIVFERNLNYAPLVRVEIVEQVAYYVWGIGSILLGAGVWGLASAAIVRVLVGTAAMLSVSPIARLVPGYSWPRLKPMLGFGIKFQAVGLVGTGGEQLLNVGVAGIGGLAVLGLWAMASRLLQIPFLLFNALWRVSYPAAAQLLVAGESARKMIERGLGLAAVGTGVILAPVTGSLSPLIPAALGHRWAPVADILPPIFFALQVSGPISVATAGYLYAVGDTTAVLRAVSVTSLMWLLVSLPLLPSMGPMALGVGGMVSAFAEIPFLSIPAHRRTGASFLKPVLMPWIAASFAGGCGWLVSRTVSHGFIAALLGATVALCFYVCPVVLFRREEVLTIIRLGLRAVKSGNAPPAQST